MTKLESIEHKIFASEAPLDEIGQFGSALDTTKLNTKDVTTIQALPAYTKGWGSAIISDNNYPTMEEMNGVLNVMSYHTGYLYQEGIPVWRNDREYSATSIVKEPTGTKLFHSLKDGNIGNALDNAEYWEELKLGGSGLEIGDISMALYVDETKGLRRYLNGQIVDINTNTQAFLNRLLEIKNTNPDYFTTEDNWQSEALLNIDGCVYKFVLNYSGETVVSVRLPKYPDYVEINAGGTLPVVGNGMTLGFTNGINNGGFSVQTNGSPLINTDLYGKPINTAFGANTYLKTGKSFGITTDGTKSGIQTTLNQTKLKMRYFIQIATGSETEANIVNTLENVNGFTLLESKYSDKPLYNESWLLSNGQWNPSGVYITAYEGLQVEHNTGIEAGTTVTLPSGVSYTKRGLSVKLSTETYTDYDFVLNTTDETFRLPLKTKQKFYDDTAPVVGNGMTLGLTDGTTNTGLMWPSGANQGHTLSTTNNYGANIGTSTTWGYSGLNSNKTVGVTSDPTKSGLETHLTENTDLYLYFYVGETVQNANLIDAGRIGEQLANKQDKCIHIIDTYVNGTSWYRVWSDGWCEQGGKAKRGTVVQFIKPFKDTSYTVTTNCDSFSTNWTGSVAVPLDRNSIQVFAFQNDIGFDDAIVAWRACGYIS